MKKLLSLTLVAVFLCVMSIGVFAEEPVNTSPNEDLKAELTQLRDELKDLRAEHQGLHEQVLQKRDTIKETVSNLKESGSLDKLEAIKPYREELKGIREELKNLRTMKNDLWKEIKDARTAKDFETVKTKLTQVIDYKKQIIQKVDEKIQLLDTIINTL
ncbi:MAG: hypothetical protein ACM3TR_04335 [Caulobacteraceae bacterium]